MHKIKKYFWGGGVNNSSLSQWANTLGLPSTLATIQQSSNFLNSTIPRTQSTDWMKNIGKTTPTLSTPDPLQKGISSLGNFASTLPAVSNIKKTGDLGRLIGGGFNNLLGQGGSNVMEGIKNFTGLSTKGVIGVGGELASLGLSALGIKKADAGTASVFDKGLSTASNVAMAIPGAGTVVAGILKGADVLNKHFGSTTKKQGTDDMGYLLGYGYADVNQRANTKLHLSDRIKGWFGKNKQKTYNKLTDQYNRDNLSKYAAGFGQQQEWDMAKNTMSSIHNNNMFSMLGGVNTRMIAAKQGGKISKRELKEIVRKAQKGAKLQQIRETKEVNVIPEGAFHSRKNNLPEDIAKQVTPKGIPVVSEEGGGKLKQHAEVEKNEIIFHKTATETIEDLRDKYNKAETQKEKDELAIECGKYIANEILVNTEDRTGLIDTI